MGSRVAVVVALLALVAFAASAGAARSARADGATLTATVGTNDGFQLSLVDASGTPVTHLDAGTYTVVVHDRSTFHNFHLFGPGNVDVKTAVETAGDQSFTVTLVDGAYIFQCDPHASSGMKGQFTVGGAAAPVAAVKLSGAIRGSKTSLTG